MKSPLTAFSVVRSGNKLDPCETSWPEEIARFPDGSKLLVTIKPWESSRTLLQNNFYHVHREWFRRIEFERNGNAWTPSQSETMFKLWFGWYDIVERNQEDGTKKDCLVFRPTHNLSKTDFNQLFWLIREAQQEKWPEEYLPTMEL